MGFGGLEVGLKKLSRFFWLMNLPEEMSSPARVHVVFCSIAWKSVLVIHNLISGIDSLHAFISVCASQEVYSPPYNPYTTPISPFPPLKVPLILGGTVLEVEDHVRRQPFFLLFKTRL